MSEIERLQREHELLSYIVAGLLDVLRYHIEFPEGSERLSLEKVKQQFEVYLKEREATIARR